MGLGTQMVAWHDDFCTQLAERGFFVIRHDNRDIGRSTHLDALPIPSLAQLLKRDRNSPYTLADMAADSVGVLDQPRDRAGPHRRRLDGRDDRPDARDPVSRSAR